MKIGIIVDSPQRDLMGHSYLAAKLSESNNKVILIPLYEQQYVIDKYELDIIIFNYLRPNNYWLIALARSKGIKIVILDTEGARGKNLDKEARYVAKAIVNLDVNLYFTWSENVRLRILKNFNNLNNKVITAGCYRFYLYNPKFKFNEIKNKYILINTRFPKANPKYAKAELTTLTEAGFFEQEEAVRYLNEEKIVLKDFIKNIINITLKFPNENFILRPHPFESIDIYKDKISHLTNIKIQENGDIIDLIKNSKLMIHLNCQTCFETYISNVKSIELEYINKSTLKALDASKVSYQAKSIEDAINQITKNLKNKDLNFTEENFENKVNDIIFHFGPINKSIETILNHIEKLKKVNSNYNKTYKLGISFSKFFKFKIKTMLPHFITLKLIKVLKKKNWTNRKWKTLKLKDINNFFQINNINKISVKSSNSENKISNFKKVHNLIIIKKNSK